ncbi:trithorax group protein osa-like [Eupeodes corollae]|uniref:trithorax group protein osa-like n=1 Tax=Eupeodes corollae TaxID=290404 RepID=UPI002490762A|nr:trithorax group protein osa-like [Eupeodes corollae]
MKVKVCIAILALLALTVRESDGFVKGKPIESDKGSLEVSPQESKSNKTNVSETDGSVKSQNNKHKRGIHHFGSYGAGPALGWPGQYASVYGYNLNFPPQGLHIARGLQPAVHSHPAVHGYPVAHGIPTGYGLPAYHGIHGYHAVQPFNGIQTLHGVQSHGIQPLHGAPSVHTLQSHGIQPFHGVPSVHTVQSSPGVHALQPVPSVAHGVPTVHGVQAGIPSVQYPWQFKSHTPSYGTPFVLKPGGAVVSSFNVNYPQQHHHHQHIPTGVAFPSVTGVTAPIPITPVAAAVPVAPARPAPPIVPAIPVAPVPTQAPVIPSFPSQPNFPVFIVPSRPTLTTPIGPAVPPSQFFPNIGVLPLQPLQPGRPQRPSGGSAEASPQIPTGSQPAFPQLPPSPTQQPWRPVISPQQPQHPQHPQHPHQPQQPQQPQQPRQPQQPQQPQQPPTTISSFPDFNRPSITLLPPFVSRPPGGDGILSEQIPNNNPQSQGYHYGVGESVQPNLLDGLTDEEIQGAIAQANFQAQLHQNNNNLGYQY